MNLLIQFDSSVAWGPETLDHPRETGAFEQAARAVAAPVELSVVIPTYCERENLAPLVELVADALAGVAWEIIFVDDDSPDGTADMARALHARDPRVRTVRRIGRRGLASACVEGMLAASAPFLAVMDADLQHDPAVLASMYAQIRRGREDIVVASRYTAGGSLGDWSSRRAAASRFATRIAQRLAPVPLSDPMSGFFMLRRELIDRHAHRLSAVGYKIFLDIVLTVGPGIRIAECPYAFKLRTNGESKLSARVVWEYLMLLADKTIGGVLPIRFVGFAAIGGAGLVVHFLVLAAALSLGAPFVAGQAGATAAAILFNFTLNNILTYSDRRLRAWRWWAGLLSFAAICGFGGLASVGVAAYLFDHQTAWPLAALAGISVSAVWNYGVTARYTWDGGR